MKVLIADDDKFSRKILETIFSKFSKCEFAENGVEAIAKFRSSLDLNDPFDLVCLDILMPEMDGLDVLKSFRLIEKHRNINPMDGTKILMLSGLNDSQSILGSFSAGCEAYIVKPIKEKVLLKKIKEFGVLEN